MRSVEKAVRAGFAHGMFQHAAEITPFCDWLVERWSERPTVLEIGAHRGGTARMFLELGARVVSIDLPDGPWGGIGFDKAKERNEALRRDFPASFVGILGDSHELDTKAEAVGALCLYGAPDLLFIDGDHSYQGAKADHDLYLGLVRCDGGVVAFHDINDTAFHRDRGVMVSKFWNELQGNKHTFSIDDAWGGIGALIV